MRSSGRLTTAIEVKSGRAPEALPGMDAFAAAFNPGRTLLVGGDGVSVEDFLSMPADVAMPPMPPPAHPAA
jgi:hypothetical protein